MAAVQNNGSRSRRFSLLTLFLLLCLVFIFFDCTASGVSAARALREEEEVRLLGEEDNGFNATPPTSTPGTSDPSPPPPPGKLNKRDPENCYINGAGKIVCETPGPIRDPPLPSKPNP